MREAARDVFARYLKGDLAPAPVDHALVRACIDFVAGVDVPEEYAAFAIDEQAIEGESSKAPRWSTAERAAGAAMKVLIIGAGMSGLLTAIRLKEAGAPFEIVEKNADVGGTWLENSYPGCRVDCSNHVYSYSFEPNPHWPQHFSTQPVLLQYFREIADRYGLRDHIRFGVEVTALDWQEASATWRATLRTSAGEETLEATAVVSAVGQLNRPSIPDIPGAETFAGPAFHTARWRHDVELKGKRVAVIGTGASAFQAVPEIAGEAARLSVFQRTPPWLIPVPHYHEGVAEALQHLLAEVPAYAQWYRFYMFWASTEGLLPAMASDPAWDGGPHAVSQANAELRGLLEASIAMQTAERPDLAAHAVPAYPIGGKRALVDNGVWFAALKRDNVRLVTEGIREIARDGVVTADGELHPADVIVWATGFQPSRFLTPIRVTGRGGRRLKDRWDGDARAYLGIAIPEFPNFFMLYGPNTNIVVNGSIIFFSECSVRYVIGCLQLLAQRGAASLEVKEDVHDAFNAKVDAANAKMAWGAPQSNSWYKNAKGRVSQNWPFALIDYWRATLTPDPTEFTLTPAPRPGRQAA